MSDRNMMERTLGGVASEPGTLRVRSPSDVLRLVVASALLLVLIVVEWLFGNAVIGFVHDLLRGLDALGKGFVTGIELILRAGSLAVLLMGLVVAVAKRRWPELGTALGAAVIGALLFTLVESVIDTREQALVDAADLSALTSHGFSSSLALAMIAAAVTGAAPWLSRRARRLGWLAVFGLTTALFLVAPVSALASAALLSGWTAGALALVILKTPARRPTPDATMHGLRSVGVDVATLEPASVDARGSTPYFGATGDGNRLFVKVLGRDERDADLLFRLYRAILPRNLGDERPFSSLRRAVEHEALLALTAPGMGVRTPPLVALCDTVPDGFVLAYEAIPGKSLDGVDPERFGEDVLRQAWEQIAVLRQHRLAHRDLRLANLFLTETGEVWLIDFGFGELAASELLLATDLAELVASLSLKVGAREAVRSSVAVLGRDTMMTAVPRLRSKFLSGATRSGVKENPAILDEVKREIASARPVPSTMEAIER